MNLKRLVIWSIIGTGISSVTTQLLTIREFLSQFHGNEITISMALFCWLLMTGLGSLAAKAFKRTSAGAYALLSLLIGVAPLMQIVFIRSFREVLFTHGTAPGFYPIFLYIMVTISPYCLLAGFILPYALKVLQDRRHAFSSGDLYITDNIGDILGGALFSFVLVYWLKPFATIAVTSAFLIGVALLLLLDLRKTILAGAALIFVSGFFWICMTPSLELRSLAPQYGHIARYVESPFGRIIISREGNQTTFWESGVPLYSDANIVNSEEKVHYPLSQLDHVGRVLLISGGLGETLTEVFKHRPRSIDYVELDPNLTETALKLGVIAQAPNLEIINTDARHYIKTTERRYDAIIIDLPDPDTFQVNRFFTTEFFSLAKKILKPDGVLSMGVAYSQNYVSDVRRRKLSSLYNTARSHFKNVRVIPGEEAYLLCRDRAIVTDIPARLNMKSIRTSYIEGFFYGNVTAERLERLEGILDKDEVINADFEPRLMNIVFEEWFTTYGSSPWIFVGGVLVLTVVYLIFMKREEYILFSTGLAVMGAEMLIIFTFQVMYGYIYLKIGAIVTAFLVGLLPGAFMSNVSGRRERLRLFGSDLILIALLGLFYVWVVFLKADLHPFAFIAYCFLFSFFCGYQFPVAARLIGEKSSPAARCLAADLTGASLGTLAAGTLLIPLLGIRSAVIFLMAVKMSSAMLIMVKRKSRIHGWKRS